MDQLVLASASPQRARLLDGLGWQYKTVHPDLDETTCLEYDPLKRNSTLALLKAQDVSEKIAGRWVLGSDTLVVAHDGTLLEKPLDEEQATDMLTRQSGTTSVVHSSICLLSPDGKPFEGQNSSEVTFTSLTEDDIAWWVSTGLWQGRSGGFQIDGLGQFMIEHLSGDWTSVVGLPVYLLGQLVGQAGCDFTEE